MVEEWHVQRPWESRGRWVAGAQGARGAGEPKSGREEPLALWGGPRGPAPHVSVERRTLQGGKAPSEADFLCPAAEGGGSSDWWAGGTATVNACRPLSPVCPQSVPAPRLKRQRCIFSCSLRGLWAVSVPGLGPRPAVGLRDSGLSQAWRGGRGGGATPLPGHEAPS